MKGYIGRLETRDVELVVFASSEGEAKGLLQVAWDKYQAKRRRPTAKIKEYDIFPLQLGETFEDWQSQGAYQPSQAELEIAAKDSFDELGGHCEWRIETECGHPKAEFDCISCAACNCPLMLEE